MVNSEDLLTAIKFVKHALPKNDKRAQLHGIWLTGYDGKLRIEASNGHVLARCTLDVPGMLAGETASIRTDNLPRVEAWLRHEAAAVTLGDLLQRPQIDGPILDFDRVFPRGKPKGVPVIGFDARLLELAMKAARVVANPKYAGVTLTTYSATDALLVTISTVTNPCPTMTDDAYVIVMPMRL